MVGKIGLSWLYILAVPLAVSIWKPSLSHKWLIFNLSLQYSFIIQPVGNENTQSYPAEVVFLI